MPERSYPLNTRRLIRWIWISAAVTGGSVFAVYFLANRTVPAFIVLGVVVAVATASHIWARRRGAATDVAVSAGRRMPGDAATRPRRHR